MVPIPAAIMKALGHSDLQMTMHYVSPGKSNIREYLEKLNRISIRIYTFRT
jgi:integrase